MQRVRNYIFGILILMSQQQLLAQPKTGGNLFPDTLSNPVLPTLYTIGDIVISGNKKTKPAIILREIAIHSGDTYSVQELLHKIEDSRKQLMNTTLFNSVVVAAKDFREDKVDILIEVKERWYLFPVPVLRPADRDFNQWLFEKDASLKRVEYGLKVLYNNATGRNDKLRLWLINGYTKQVAFTYDRVLGNELKWGLNTAFAYGKNREMSYNTIDDKQVFYKDDRFIRSFVNARAGISYRKEIRTRHSFGISFTSETVSDSIVERNPSYFKPGRNRAGFPGIYYMLDFIDLDYIPYPTFGNAAKVTISKNGFNHVMNMWQLQLNGSFYRRVSPLSFIELNTYGTIKLPFRQPYFNKRMLGYGDIFMQGYEYYVIDGVAGGYIKTAFTHEFANFDIRIGKRSKTEKIPFRIFGKIFGNAGYVYDPEPGNNQLSNKMLFSGGIGIDILTMYDVTVKLEWSFNQLGQNGLFLHRKTIF